MRNDARESGAVLARRLEHAPTLGRGQAPPDVVRGEGQTDRSGAGGELAEGGHGAILADPAASPQGDSNLCRMSVRRENVLKRG